MNSYVFGVNYSNDGPQLDFFIDVTQMVHAGSPEAYEAMLDVRARLDPEDGEVQALRRLPMHLVHFLRLRPCLAGGYVYKVDFEEELTPNDFERYLQSLPREKLREFLEKAKI